MLVINLQSKITKLLFYSLVITAVIGFISDVSNIVLNINEDEIESIFAVPLDIFLSEDYHDPSHTAYSVFWWDSQIHSSSFMLDADAMRIPFLKDLFYDKHQKYKIWGITAWVLAFYASTSYEIHCLHLHNGVRYDLSYEGIAMYLKKLVKVFKNKGKLTSRL